MMIPSTFIGTYTVARPQAVKYSQQSYFESSLILYKIYLSKFSEQFIFLKTPKIFPANQYYHSLL